MSTTIVMPKLSDTMEDGKILRWLKKPGDRVNAGDVLAEVETDKADMEIEADSAGVLAELKVPEGESAAVGDVIAVLSDSASSSPPEKTPEADEEHEEPEAPPARAARSTSREESGNGGEEGGARATPVAKKMAAERGVDLKEIRGSGPGGRVVKRDLEAAREPAKPAAKPSAEEPAPRAARPAAEAGNREPLSTIRRTIGRRMTESKRDAPHFYLTTEIEMTECARLKSALDASRPDGPKISYTHLLLRAIALALTQHPRVNARFAGDSIEFPPAINLGLAVALDDGLIVPVIHDCEKKDVFEIALTARAVVDRVRAGKPHGDDLSGGTFTLSNLGMYEVDEFSAVINPPQAAVLATGSVLERPVVRNGAIVAAPTMRATLSCDHRVLNGAEGAEFLQTLKRRLENPIELVL
jgi:pyruvate dehydrogenase E2 component (dihydrolipoamide acetyltransferase)